LAWPSSHWTIRSFRFETQLSQCCPATYFVWQADPHGASLDQEIMTRISLAIGIFKALNICFEETLADQWVTLKNRGLLFAGHAPINFMIERGPAGMKTVRRLLDSRSVGN
jgi:hypothetical protein